MRALVAGGLLALALTPIGSAAAGQPPASVELLDSVLAFVDGQVIMRSDVRAFSELGLVPAGATGEDEVLTALIERQLVLAEVDRYVVAEPTAAEVDARLAGVVERAGGPEALQATLPLLGFTRSDIRQILHDDLRIERYLARRFPSSAVRPDLIDEWIASLSSRAEILRVGR